MSALICLPLLLCAGPLQGQAEADETPAPTAEIRQLLEQEIERQGLVGLQATVAVRGTTLLSQAWGFADLDHHVPVTAQTRMPIASVTKALTGVLYLRLLEAHAFEPQADVRTLVPEFPEKPQGPILLDQLVGQTHGIRHYRDEVYPRSFVVHYEGLADALDLFAEDELLARPGERYTYSSYAYSLLGLALERAAGRPFPELLASHVLEPAGMQRTRPNDIRAPLEGRATCYSYYDSSWPFEAREDLIEVPALDFSYNAAGGSLLSTTDDLVRFGNCLLAGELLSAASLERLMTSQTNTEGRPTGWSHGWFVIGEGDTLQLRINGSNPGSWAHLRLYPARGIVIAMATNTWGKGSRSSPKGLIQAMDDTHDLVVASLVPSSGDGR